MSVIIPVNATENNPTSIYISFPIDIASSTLENIIQDKCPDININVYKKIRDFNREVKKNKPDAIINLNHYSQIKGYEHFLQGIRNYSENEPYVLITNDKAININDLDGLEIGVVDFVGKNILSKKLSELLKADVKVISLFKNSSITSTLLFYRVDAIFASEKTYLHQKSKTTLNLISNNLDVSMKLVSVSIRKNNNKTKQIRQCIRRFDEKINAFMGVEQWK